MPVCAVCSGGDFIRESGYYFCSECQTQSQDVREAFNDGDDNEYEGDEGKAIGGKRRRSSTRSTRTSEPPPAVQENMTSWEGFNYALVGLVDELICLGVEPQFKTTVLRLWTAYLAKMEVAFVSKSEPVLPKLGPNFKHCDAQIIYGFSKKKAKEVKNEVHDVEDDDDCLLEKNSDDPAKKRTARRRSKKAFQLNYEKTMHEMSLASQTLTDVTLEMLNVSEQGTENEPEQLQLNTAGEKFKELKCGPRTHHPGLLARSKLLSLLHLGLLVSHQKLNLSDLLRWISEGHVSYCNLSKFFPPEVNQVGETYVAFGRSTPVPTYSFLLLASQHLASYIGVKAVKAPILKELIQHYLKELNLPAQIGLLATRLLALLPSQADSVKLTTEQSSTMPNWEGRAMAHIIIALKLLLGLDDVTEHRNSRVCKRMNELIASQSNSIKLFEWDDWVRFCNLRRTAFMLMHHRYSITSDMPTSSIQNIEPTLLDWKRTFRPSVPIYLKRQPLLMETHRWTLKKLQDKEPDIEKDEETLSFPASVTPYSAYIEIITRACYEGRVKKDSSEWSRAVRGLNIEMLKKNFTDTKVDYLTHPESYVEWAQQHGLRVGLHKGSAANLIKVPKPEAPKPLNKNTLNFHRVKVYLHEVEGLPLPSLPQNLEVSEFLPHSRSYSCHRPIIFPKTVDKVKKDPLPTIKDMEPESKLKGKAGRPKNLKKSCKRPQVEFCDLPKKDADNMLHLPHTEYWMRHWIVPEHRSSDIYLSEKAWQLPESFQFLLEECASFLEMSSATLLKEVTDLEVLHKDLSISVNQRIKGSEIIGVPQFGKEECLKDLKLLW